MGFFCIFQKTSSFLNLLRVNFMAPPTRLIINYTYFVFGSDTLIYSVRRAINRVYGNKYVATGIKQ